MYKKKSHIKWYEKIFAHVKYWGDFFGMISAVRHTFKNPYRVLWNVFNSKFPLEVQLKNNTKIIVESFNAVYLISNVIKLNIFVVDSKKDQVRINCSVYGKELIFQGGVNNGDIANVFVKKEYDFLDVKNKIVVDIGANIGDTAIYFMVHGARKVIGLEPFHKNFKTGEKNITLNNLTNEIKLVHAGCSAESKNIKINPDYESNIESIIDESEKGEEISLISLKDIIKKYEIPKDSVLKIDCEGCEYDIIQKADNETLLHFSKIQLEYHSGYRLLKEKLELIGYEVKFTKPHATDIINTLFGNFKKTQSHPINGKFLHKIGYTGFLFATRKI